MLQLLLPATAAAEDRLDIYCRGEQNPLSCRVQSGIGQESLESRRGAAGRRVFCLTGASDWLGSRRPGNW